MKCHYCGKEVWLVRHLLDGDFCSPAHRKKYHERLRRALDQLPAENGPPASVAEFLFAMPPLDSQLNGGARTCGFQSSRPWPYLPQTTVGLAPLAKQSFFGPNVAMVPAAPGVRAAVLPEPVAVAEPRLRPMGDGWTAALGVTVEFSERLMPVNGVHCDSGAQGLPVYSTPQALEVHAAQMIWPKLGMSTVLADGLVAEEAPAAPAGPAKIGTLREFIATTLEAVTVDARPRSLADALALAVRTTRHGRTTLRLTPCVLPVPGAALLAEDTVARGSAAVACRSAEAIETRVAVLEPALPACPRPSPAGETEAIWKISAATPWTLAQGTPVESIAVQHAAALLPAMMLAPVIPGLMAESETHPIAAPEMDTTAGRAYAGHAVPAAATRGALTPAMPLPQMTAALPEAVTPHLSGADSVTPQGLTAAPTSGVAMPMTSEARPRAGILAQSLDPCIDACASDESRFRLRAAEPLPHAMPAFIPQAAVARSRGSIAGSGLQTSRMRLPEAGRAGFGWTEFGAMAPQPAAIDSRRAIPSPEAIGGMAVSTVKSGISITGIGLPEPAGSIAIDVYVHRVKVVSSRECEWRPMAVAAAKPTAMPGLWPARFEQQVLQDWRRRYPARQAAVAPAPVKSKAKVVPMARQLGAFARLRQSAPPFVKGIGVAAMLSAVAWLSWSFRGVQTAVVTDRQWLRTAIAQRATRVVDDNFHSGMNLWEGRKNWARSWSYSSDGFIRTGQLALYRPTLGMRDYRLEFFGQIESKSVGWVVRAKDEQNYYAVKLAVTQPGPRPLVSVVRYPVLAGKSGKRVQIPLPIMMHNNTPYHVAVDVKGNHFRAFVENQEVDSWSDDRLRAGGVGFFSEAGEHARLYWVKVSNHTDWLGRLCGILSDDKGPDQALWDPAAAGQLAVLDPAGILDGAKNADIRRGAPVLPFAVFLGGSL